MELLCGKYQTQSANTKHNPKEFTNMDATPAYSHTVYPAKPVKNPHKAMLGFGLCALLLAVIPAVIYWH